jgi:hypothetical protein
VPDTGGTPDGTVRFEDGGTTISGCVPQLSNGVATCKVTYTSASAAPHQTTAVYNGTPYDSTSASSMLNQVVDGAGTTTSLMSSTNPSDPGQQVTYTASVAVTPPGDGAPTGTVAFTDRGPTISGCGAVAVSSGSPVCSATYPLPAGSPYHVVATYSGDADFASSTFSILTQTVNGTSSSTSVSSSANPSVSGQLVTYTATVAGARCSVAYRGTAGSPHRVAAGYGGDPMFAAASSARLSQVVRRAATKLKAASAHSASQEHILGHADARVRRRPHRRHDDRVLIG